MPDNDNPLVFGLNPNADLTASLNESRQMLSTLIDTQPSDGASAGGKSPEETVKSMIEDDFLKLLPDDFKMLEVDDRLKMMKHPRLPETGKAVPLNMFLFQEIQRFQNILGIVRNLLTDMVLAIDGQIIMSPELASAIKFMFDLECPESGYWIHLVQKSPGCLPLLLDGSRLCKTDTTSWPPGSLRTDLSPTG